MAISGQLTINIGAPNSPTNSDSLYAAFGKIQDNFTNIFTEASSFTTSNIDVGNGLSSSVVGGTITIVNTGVVSVATVGNNLTVSTSNGIATVGLANSISGLATVAASNLISASVVTSTVQANVGMQTVNLSASGNVSANNITVTTSTSVGTLLKLTPTPTPPTLPTQGTIYYDSFINMLRVYNGTSWGNIAIV